MPKKVIGFVRDSLGNKAALERQRSKIREYCDSKGYELGEIYEATGRWNVHQNDAQFSQLVSENPEAEALIVNEIGRLTHNFDEFKTILEMFRENGIEIESLDKRDQPILDESHPSHKKVMGEFEFESSILKENLVEYESAALKESEESEEGESDYSR